MLRIGGFLPLTLSDFPGTVAAMVFVRGCTMRCPYCHNHRLCEPGPLLDTQEVMGRLSANLGRVTGVVVSGGEPTVHAGLPVFLATVGSLGLRVKLDTNGSRPQALATILDHGLADHVALDVKAGWTGYDQLVGGVGMAAAVSASLSALRRHEVPYELRTTVCGGWHDEAGLAELRQALLPGERWFLQPFRRTDDLPDRGADLRPPDPGLLIRIRDQARIAGIDCHIR